MAAVPQHMPEGALAELSARLVARDERFQRSRQASMEIRPVLNAAVWRLSLGDTAGAEEKVAQVGELIAALPEELTLPRPERVNLVSNLFEHYLTQVALLHFFRTGRLLRKADVDPVIDDTEYVGAVTAVIQNLVAYSQRRATVRDVRSVAIARDLVSVVNECLMQFDFRNGPLRRKYDGVKWAVKNIETLLYEQSVYVEPHGFTKVGGTAAQDAVCTEEFDAINKRMQEFDACREVVIKGTRDVLNYSKKSVFALHRGRASEAGDQIAKAQKLAEQLIEEHVAAKADLRTAMSFGMEEWAEARIFHQWMTEGTVPAPADLSVCTTEEYLGGLADFTGEVGRYAVARATARDTDAVAKCFAVTMSVAQQIAGLPESKTQQEKLNGVQTNNKKLERIVYELSLSRPSGAASDA